MTSEDREQAYSLDGEVLTSEDTQKLLLELRELILGTPVIIQFIFFNKQNCNFNDFS